MRCMLCQRISSILLHSLRRRISSALLAEVGMQHDSQYGPPYNYVHHRKPVFASDLADQILTSVVAAWSMRKRASMLCLQERP